MAHTESFVWLFESITCTDCKLLYEGFMFHLWTSHGVHGKQEDENPSTRTRPQTKRLAPQLSNVGLLHLQITIGRQYDLLLIEACSELRMFRMSKYYR